VLRVATAEMSNVLLVEDNIGDIVSIRTMLSDLKEGIFELKFAETLGEALDILERENFDVVLLDLGLPDSQGFRTFTQVNDQMPELPIIILTGLEDEDLGINAVKEGAQDYLVKGQIDDKVLARSINYAIERKNTEEELKSSISEKEVLIKETHHRVKNNMQIISSLLNLQMGHSDEDDTIDMLKESQNRIKSMALIHEKLCQSDDLNHIKISDYINTLVTDLFYSFNLTEEQIDIKMDLEDVYLKIETAIPCGIIVNELVSNSLKYAFPNGKKGEIFVSIHSKGEGYELIVSDNGVGLPENFDYENTDSLGLQLVNNLSTQVDGTVEMDNSNGTKFIINFKDL
jgi:two-component sensor histidine kinase/CheY-like chemotaxis protein